MKWRHSFGIWVKSARFAGLFVLVLLLAVASGTAKAQVPENPLETAHVDANPLTPVDTSSPRATMLSLMNTLNLAYSRSDRGIKGSSLPLLIRASQTLDLSAYPDYQAQDRGIEAALLIKEVLDRIPLPPWDDIPGDLEVREGNDDAALLRLLDALRDTASDGASDGAPTVPASAGPVNRWVVPGTQIEIVRIADGPNAGRYLFSAATVERIYEDYELVRTLPYHFGATPDIYVAYVSTPGKGLNLTWAKRYPEWSHYRLFEQTLWQWAAAILSLLLMVVFCAGIIRWALRRDTPPPDVEGDLPQRTRRIRSILAIATAAAATEVVQFFIDDVINITGGPLYAMIQVFIVVRFAFLAWALALLIIEIADLVITARNLPRRSPHSHLILFGARLAALVGVVVVVVLASQEIGLPVYSVVTGLGIGGLAVAFAAQESLGAMFGSLMIIMDRPFRIGDHVVTGGAEGIVEDIGFRSTKIRTFEDSLLSIPNSQMAAATVDNLGMRSVRRIGEEFEIRDDTPTAQIESFLAGIRDILWAGPQIRKDDFEVCLRGFGAAGLRIGVEYYLKVPDRATERVEAQAVLLAVLRLAERLQISFAPNQAVEVAMARGPDAAVPALRAL